jgi:dihydroflavonol-4-reductase
MHQTTITEETVLVTGATGFLGRHVLHALRELHPGVRILALVREPAEWTQLDWTRELAGVELIRGGLLDVQDWQMDPRLDGLTGILHLAAVVQHSRRRPEVVYRTNIDGTLALVRLASARKCRMLFVSTSGTVGCFTTPEPQPDEDAPYCDRTVARWPYYDSKVKAERQARQLAGQLGVSLTIVRPPMLLGPGDHRFRSTSTILKYLRGKLPFLLDGGIHFTDIRDAAPAIVRALWHPAARPVYHLPGTSCSVDAFFRMCQDVCGVPAPKRKLPYQLAWTLASAAERAAHATGKHSPLPDPVVIEMAAHWWGLSSRHAQAELGYEPRAPRQTLADTIHWLRGHHESLRVPTVSATP